MNKALLLAVALAQLLVPTLVAQGSPAPVSPFTPQDFSAFGVTGSATSITPEVFNYNNTFTGTITSQAFSLGNGSYLYLYQAEDTGPSVLEVFGVSSVNNATGYGYLTGGQPIGFLLGGNTPYQPVPGTFAVTYDSAAGGLVSYGYYGFLGAQVAPGQHTAVLYVESPNQPSIGTAYAIDTGVASVSAWTPSGAPAGTVPEPSSVLALGLGGLSILMSRRRKERDNGR